MILLLCKVALAIRISGIPVIVDDTVKGTLINSNESYYVVDFSKSKQAKDPDVMSDLKEPLFMYKTDCVKVK